MGELRCNFKLGSAVLLLLLALAVSVQGKRTPTSFVSGCARYPAQPSPAQRASHPAANSSPHCCNALQVPPRYI